MKKEIISTTVKGIVVTSDFEFENPTSSHPIFCLELDEATRCIAVPRPKDNVIVWSDGSCHWGSADSIKQLIKKTAGEYKCRVFVFDSLVEASYWIIGK